jgi:pentatricopeptide repeat protein
MELCRPRPDAAVQEFAQAAALEPRNAAHWHAWASAHDQAGRPCECLQAYDEALKLDPDDLVALTKSHNALTATGQLAEAIRRLERVVELDPNYVYALKMLAAHRSAAGLLYGEEGKKTEQLIRRALRLAPDSADVWETLAHFYVRRGEWEKAWAVLQEFVAQHPDNPKGWFHYAVWHVHTGCYEAAAGAILKALALDPQDFYHYWCACMVLPCAGRRDDLRRVVEEMIERFPGRWDTYIDAGEALVRWLGEADRGCALSAQALQRQPHSPTVWLRHGGLLVQAGRYREAMAALEQGWALLSADPRPGARAGAALGLGRCYQALGDAAPAREWLKKAAHFAREAVAFDPTDGYFYLGQALESLGDVAGAIQAYQAALDHHVWYPQRQKVEETLAHLRDLS